jgi:hypothetical protein
MQANQPTQNLQLNSHSARRDKLSLVTSQPTVEERLLAAEGGCYLSNEAAELLGITEKELEQLRQTDKIIGLPVQEDRHVYPRWQFKKRLLWGYRILPGLDEVLSEFPESDPWMRAAFLLNSCMSVDLSTPLAGLKAGKLSQVLLLTHRFGEHGAA